MITANNLLLSPSLKLWLWLGGIVAAVALVIAGVGYWLYKYGRKKQPNRIVSLKLTYVRLVVFVIFAIYAFTLIYPFYWLIINSFKEKLEVRLDPFSMPKEWLWSNYSNAFEQFNLGEMFFNTISLTVGGTLLATLTTTIAAYTMAKFKFRGREFMHTFIILSMTIPTLGSLPATYKLMIDTGLFGTYLGMMLMNSGGFGGHYLYMFAFFKGISWDYAESAKIDGASNWQIFTHIMIPLAMPMVTMIMIMKVLALWNDYWQPYLFYSNHPTLAVGLQDLKNKAVQLGEYSKLFAAMVIGTMPVIAFYLIFQKKLMSVTFGGGLKG